MKLFRSRRRDEKLPLLVFREFEAGVNLIEDYDQIARNFLGKIRRSRPGPSSSCSSTMRTAAASSRPRPWTSAKPRAGRSSSRAIRAWPRWLKVNETHLEISKHRPGCTNT